MSSKMIINFFASCWRRYSGATVTAVTWPCQFSPCPSTFPMTATHPNVTNLSRTLIAQARKTESPLSKLIVDHTNFTTYISVVQNVGHDLYTYILYIPWLLLIPNYKTYGIGHLRRLVVPCQITAFGNAFVITYQVKSSLKRGSTFSSSHSYFLEQSVLQ